MRGPVVFERPIESERSTRHLARRDALLRRASAALGVAPIAFLVPESLLHLLELRAEEIELARVEQSELLARDAQIFGVPARLLGGGRRVFLRLDAQALHLTELGTHAHQLLDRPLELPRDGRGTVICERAQSAFTLADPSAHRGKRAVKLGLGEQSAEARRGERTHRDRALDAVERDRSPTEYRERHEPRGHSAKPLPAGASRNRVSFVSHTATLALRNGRGNPVKRHRITRRY